VRPSGLPKSKASKAPVPLQPLLAQFMLFWKQKTTVSAAGRLGISFIPTRGQTAARRQHACRRSSEASCSEGGILFVAQDIRGHLIDDDARRFGFHNLRHSLASFLICIRTIPKTVQTLLRHSDVRLTLQFLQSRSQPGFAWPQAGRKMLAANSQPSGGQERTDSGLSRSAIGCKLFKIMRVP